MFASESGFIAKDSNGSKTVPARASAWRSFLKIPVSYSSFGNIVAVCDFFLIVFLGWISNFLYKFIYVDQALDLERFGITTVVSALIFCLLLQSQHLYRTSSLLNPTRQVRHILSNWAIVFCLLLAVGFLGKLSWEFSRGAIICFFCAGALALPLSHMLGRRCLKFLIETRRLSGRRRVALIGDIDQLSSRNIASSLGQHGYSVVNEIGFKLNRTDQLKDLGEIEASIDRLKQVLRDNGVDEVFLALDNSDRRIMEIVANNLRSVPIPVRLLFDEMLSRMLSRPVVDLGTAKSIKLQSGPLSESQQFYKRLFDLVISVFSLVVLAPVFVTIALAIRLDSRGPILFRQRRTGFSGRIFRIYKFRSMTTLDDGAIIKQASKNDDRVTRVGRLLRKTSLDELPQLLNVIRGEMSLVGPRPHALSHDNEYDKVIATYALRHHMKPGITGWAQVNGCRGETADLSMMEARVRYDLWYIKHWSLMLDIKAVVKTCIQILYSNDAY